MSKAKPTAAENAAEIKAMQTRLTAVEAMFGPNSQAATGLRNELNAVRLIAEQAQSTATKASVTANLALKKGDQTRRILNALGDRVAEDHDSLVTLLDRFERLQASGGSASNFVALVAAGFDADQREAIMTLVGQEGGDDAFAATLVLGLRAELMQLGDVVADTRNRVIKTEDGLTSLMGRTTNLEDAFGELKDSHVELNTRVTAIASANGGTSGQPRWGLGLIAGIGAAILALLIARNWADLSVGWSWFTAAVVGVASFWIASSFETAGTGPNAFGAAFVEGVRSARRVQPVTSPAPSGTGANITTRIPVTAGSSN